MNDYVIINGVNSNTISGLKISKLPPITKPQMRTLIETIDGRDGDLITDLGYSAYDKQLEIGLWGTYDINTVISFFNQEGTITFSNEADKFYNFKIINQIDYQKLLKFKTAVVVMHCQPFKYPTSETPIEGTPTTITGEGESLTLNNTLEAPLEIDLKGNTYQYSTTGKNKLSPIANASASDNGITLTNNNGVYKLNGSTPSTGGSNITRSLSSNYTIQSGDYLHIGNSVANSSVSIGLLNSGTQISAPSFSEVNRIVSLNDKAGQTINQFRIYTTSNQSVNMDIKPMICNISSATDFEYFTGGIPSPNPDYPQDIQVVSGDNTIKVEGKNLFNKDTSEAKKFVRKSDGTIQSSNDWSASDYIQIQPSTQYIYSGITNGWSGNAGTSFYDETKTFISSINSTEQTFTTPNNAKYVRISLNTETPTQVQLEKGNQATTYTPYVSQTYPIYLGVENLFKNRTSSTTSQSIEITPQDDGGIKLYGTSGGGINTILIDTSNAPIINDGSYTRSVKVVGTITKNGKNVLITGRDSNNSNVMGDLAISENSIAVKTSDITGSYTMSGIGLYVDGAGVEFDCTIYIQLEKGSKANHYTPYGTTPIELCKIGDYQDYIYKDNGKWYLHKEIGKVVLDGSENWQNSQYGTNSYSLSNSNVKLSKNNEDTNVYAISNIFKGIPINDRVSSANYLLYITTSLADTIAIRNTTYSNINDFKSMIASKNPCLYYVLATPTNEEITGELLSQLNALEGANSYDNQTNINQDNNDYPFWLSASTTFNAPITINNIGNIYAKPILELEGSGNITINLNSQDILSISLGDTTTKIVLDIPNLEAYNPTDSTLMNRLVVGDYMKFLINSGNNTLKIDGNITSYRLTSYTRYL